jgi:hypothetical protein
MRMNNFNITVNVFPSKEVPVHKVNLKVVVFLAAVAALLVVFFINPKLCEKIVRALISTCLD